MIQFKTLLIIKSHLNFLFFNFKAVILKSPGINDSANGYTNDNPKLIPVSLINIIWVFLYTAQKHEIKYQQNNIKNKLIIKNTINFIFKHFCIFLALFFALEGSSFISDFNSKILFSVNDKFFNKILARAVINEE